MLQHGGLRAWSPPVFQILDGNLNQIKKDSTRTVQDSLFFDPTYNSNNLLTYVIKE